MQSEARGRPSRLAQSKHPCRQSLPRREFPPPSASSGKTLRMKINRFISALCLVAAVLVSVSSAQDSAAVSANLALTPPMGWNSWNRFACNVSEDLIKGCRCRLQRA